jgi:hypothetical protein
MLAFPSEVTVLVLRAIVLASLVGCALELWRIEHHDPGAD